MGERMLSPWQQNDTPPVPARLQRQSRWLSPDHTHSVRTLTLKDDEKIERERLRVGHCSQCQAVTKATAFRFNWPSPRSTLAVASFHSGRRLVPLLNELQH